MFIDETYNHKEGITLGTYKDICIDCRKEGKKVKYGDLEYKEVFRLNNNGIPICYCLDHFKKKLGKYILLDSDSLLEDDDEEENSSTNCDANCDTIEEESVEQIPNETEKPKRTRTTTKKNKENN